MLLLAGKSPETKYIVSVASMEILPTSLPKPDTIYQYKMAQPLPHYIRQQIKMLVSSKLNRWLHLTLKTALAYISAATNTVLINKAL